MLHPPEMNCTLLSYPAPLEHGCTLLSYALPPWAMLHPPELCYILLIYTAPFWATLHPLGYAIPYWARLYPIFNSKDVGRNMNASLSKRHHPQQKSQQHQGCTRGRAGCIPFHRQQHKHAGSILRHHCIFTVPESWTVRHPASPEPELIKMLMPGEVRYRNKGIQSGTGILRYRTKMPDDRMPVPMAQCRCPAMVIVNFIPPVRDYKLGLRNMAVNAVVKNNFVSPSGRGFAKWFWQGQKRLATPDCVYTLYKLHKSHHPWNALKPSGQHRKDWASWVAVFV